MRARWLGAVLVLAVVAAIGSQAQVVPGKYQREYKYAEVDVRKALHDLESFKQGKLPSFEGFIDSKSDEGGIWERPFFQLECVVVPKAADTTIVRVRANLSGWFSDPNTSGNSGYRQAGSNGRLETDFLDRLQQTLDNGPANSARRLEELQKKITDAQAQKEKLTVQAAELRAQIARMEPAFKEQAAPMQFVTVKARSATVYKQASRDSGSVLSAATEDEFQVIEERGGWAQVRLGANSTGWVERAELDAPREVQQPLEQAKQTTAELDPGFVITKEDVTMFLGDWSPLKGKNTLFIYVRPLGIGRDTSVERNRKLGYAKQVFAERYRAALHSRQDFDGVVVIFLGGTGGIAAARVQDIQQWVDGRLPEKAFLQRCSLEFLPRHGME